MVIKICYMEYQRKATPQDTREWKDIRTCSPFRVAYPYLRQCSSKRRTNIYSLYRPGCEFPMPWLWEEIRTFSSTSASRQRVSFFEKNRKETFQKDAPK
ncbi:Hypothetical protein NTJ_05348 [Nesidiocoris tenuis]|uniref:Uncharacterized protein n=1 Tax=Nesidiocoris tenuis TaxID=355587 RepID=A0ABN7AM87_9HEMI|nr:Hypothetical protein NTJ_05348 [Nesidiocoris tenuis]